MDNDGVCAIANDTCGIHVHVGAEIYTAKAIRNLVNVIGSKEDLLFEELKVGDTNEYYYKKVEQMFVEEMNSYKADNNGKRRGNMVQRNLAEMRTLWLSVIY